MDIDSKYFSQDAILDMSIRLVYISTKVLRVVSNTVAYIGRGAASCAAMLKDQEDYLASHIELRKDKNVVEDMHTPRPSVDFEPLEVAPIGIKGKGDEPEAKPGEALFADERSTLKPVQGVLIDENDSLVNSMYGTEEKNDQLH